MNHLTSLPTGAALQPCVPPCVDSAIMGPFAPQDALVPDDLNPDQTLSYITQASSRTTPSLPISLDQA